MSASPNPPVKSVVIIGAGLAGLAAAHKLCNSSLKEMNLDVKVLEAKAHPGGRTKSLKWANGKYTIELGARFLYYFESETSLTDFIEQKNLASKKTGDGSYDEIFTEIDTPNIHLFSSGAEIKHSSALYYKEIYNELVDEMCECSRTNDWSYEIKKEWPKLKSFDPKTDSVRDYLEMRFSEAINASPDLPLPLGCSPWQIFERMIAYEAFNNGALEFEKYDMSTFSDYQIPSCQYTDNASYNDIVSTLVQELPAGTLQCSNVVSSIQWSPQAAGTQVTVSCEDGTMYNAHHVIVTPSIGVLKTWLAAGTITPPLPASKTESIMKLGMGEGCCIQFEFAAPLLERSHQAIEFFWSDDDLKRFAKLPWIQGLDLLMKEGESNIYNSWHSGEKARMLETLTENELADGLCRVLEIFLKKPIPTPRKIHRGRWTSDPYTLGSYSYCAKGSNKKDRVTLFEPVDGATPFQLLFAGEATHPTIFATTNGAFATGVREADRLLKHYTKQ